MIDRQGLKCFIILSKEVAQMFFRTSDDTKRQLLLFPETGMGYQVITGRIAGGSDKEYVIYNSELIIESNKLTEFRQRVNNLGYSTIRNEAKSVFFERDTIALIPRRDITGARILSDSERINKHRHPNGRSAIDNKKEPANGKDVFVRLTAFENDIRIDRENRKLTPGTYTTTYNDYRVCLNYNDDPIDRYALPNSTPIKWAFYVKPIKSDILQEGIVQPAFGHDGGGIEVYFEEGTSQNTLFDKKPYGRQ